MNKLIYIACPLTRGDTTENVARADAAMLALMRAGFGVHNPALSCYAGAAGEMIASDKRDLPHFIFPDAKAHGDFRSITHADWLTMDKIIVSRCDAVLRIPGESTGADIETAHAAELGIPVFHTLHELVEHFREGDK